MANMDEDRLSRLMGPLPLAKPSDVAHQLEQAGGTTILFTGAGQAAVQAWGAIHQAAQVLQELSKAVPGLLKAQRQSKLVNPRAVLRALPVLAMSAFLTEGEELRQDLSGIMGVDIEDVPALIRKYRKAAEAGQTDVVDAVDRRIRADALWGPWAQAFVKEGGELARPQETATHWEFPDSPISKENSNGICHWLFRRR
jgi:hypothetical protein